MQKVTEEGERNRKLLLYASITALLAVLALASFLIVPHGGGVDACAHLIIANSRYSCLTNLAVSELNASVCGYMRGAYASDCYSRVALGKNDSSICNAIENNTGAYACTAAVAINKSDASLCYGIGEPYRTTCIREIASAMNNQTLCSAISNSTKADECASVIGLKDMLYLKDAGYCRNVSASADNRITGRILTNFTSGLNSSLLSTSGLVFGIFSAMPGLAYTARDVCYFVAAYLLKDGSLCGGISNSTVMGYCSAYAGQYGPQPGAGAGNLTNTPFNYTQLISACSNAGNYTQTCAQVLELVKALRDRNASICGQLSGMLGTDCYMLLAGMYKDAGYCDSITNASQRGACVNSTANVSP